MTRACLDGASVVVGCNESNRTPQRGPLEVSRGILKQPTMLVAQPMLWDTHQRSRRLLVVTGPADLRAWAKPLDGAS